ncbi:class I SAM-dependent methyltransferase [soil metagenome]|jgi:2-polyprenyl-3-methyl-5-hydroxy-6-metoxy-1,4-benzoquinol methylase|nr:methyltransferase domain-containing protein [Gemmatimonadota bacterium]MDQ3309021.1 methyltransferase domain-containing protein [Gemmatimonadota bacterium]MDQ3523111.1 methyltransferase domain-containing protein [Gemmatimonadota bacterium]
MIPRASGADEWMDAPEQDAADLDRALAGLRGVNRWLGGTRVVLTHLRRMLRRAGAGTHSLLDVATGSADIPLVLASTFPRLEIVATDAHGRTLELARRQVGDHPRIRVEPADALDLPYSDKTFDFALCSTALHHFEPPEAVQALGELARVASRGIIVNDLRRSPLNLLGAKLLAVTVWRHNRLTRHDGPLSVRRSYTPTEMALLAQAAGLQRGRVYTHLPFRHALVVEW